MDWLIQSMLASGDSSFAWVIIERAENGNGTLSQSGIDLREQLRCRLQVLNYSWLALM